MKIIRPVTITPSSILSSTAENVEAAWSEEAPYAKGVRVIADDRRRGPSVYQSAMDDNTGNQPDISPDEWVRVGPTNKWAPFDGSASTISESEGGFSLSFKPGAKFEAVGLFELYGRSVRVWVTVDGQEDPVFDKTLDLIDGSRITSWKEYFFADFDFIRDTIIYNIPPYGISATVHLEITGSGRTGVGEIVVGMITELGDVEHGASHEIRDYSLVKEDDFGNVELQPGAYAKINSLQLFVPKSRHRAVTRILTELRGRAAVFIGSSDPDYEPLIVLGIVRTWRAAIPYPTKTLFDLEIRGLK